MFGSAKYPSVRPSLLHSVCEAMRLCRLSGLRSPCRGGEVKYRTIVADPPWPVKGDAVLRPWVIGEGGRRKRATVFPYPLMTMADIHALPVGDLAAPEAHLYLWTTIKLNAAGLGKATVEAWGFDWVGEIIWKKNNFGFGWFPRPQHEVIVVARRGKLKFKRRDVGSVQEWKQDYSANGGKRHSVKPEGFLDLVESNSPGPYLELFARRNRLGWHTWGNQALEHVEVAAPENPLLGALRESVAKAKAETSAAQLRKSGPHNSEEER